MAKTFKNAETVAQIRSENVSGCFNMIAALEAAKATPVSVRCSGKLSQLSHDILEVLKAAGTPLTCKQIYNALVAGDLTGYMKSVPAKKVNDYVWGLCFKQKKLSQPQKGMYEYIQPTE